MSLDLVTKEIIEKTAAIDFGCCFIDGECIAARERRARRARSIGPSCCTGCHHNHGYLRTKDLPEEYLPYFSYPDGFLTPTGCGLPVEMRSKRCLTYACGDSLIADSDREILIQLERGV